MKVSTKGRYALRMMVDLAAFDGEEYISLRDVAERQGVSMKYMEQIVSQLTHAGLLYSVRGPQGGYRLVKRPQEYRVGDILRATEGDLMLVSCLGAQPNPCPRAAACPTLPLWEGLQQHILEYVDGVTLQDLVNTGQEKREALQEEEGGAEDGQALASV